MLMVDNLEVQRRGRIYALPFSVTLSVTVLIDAANRLEPKIFLNSARDWSSLCSSINKMLYVHNT